MNRKSEWQAAVEKKRQRHAEDLRHSLRSVAQAEVPASRLIESDEWRFYQQMLQASVEEAKVELATLIPRLLSSEAMSHDSLLMLKMRGVELQQHITTLEMAIELPSRIKKDANAARKWLEEKEWQTQS